MQTGFGSVRFGTPKKGAQSCPEYARVERPIRLYSRNQSCERMRITPDARNSVFFGFDECRSCSAKRVQKEIIRADSKR